MTQPDIDFFIARWQGSGGAERANYGLFLPELCDVLGVERPHAATGSRGDYRFERPVGAAIIVPGCHVGVGSVIRHASCKIVSNPSCDL